MSDEKKSVKPPRSSLLGLVLAVIVSVVGACAMAGSILLQNMERRFPANGVLNNMNVARPFNSTRTFNMQVTPQRIAAGFGIASWLNVVGFACLLAIAIIVVILLLQSR